MKTSRKYWFSWRLCAFLPSVIACHAEPERLEPLLELDGQAASLPTLWDSRKLCPLAFQLSSDASGESGFLGIDDTIQSDPAQVVVSVPRFGAPTGHAWMLLVTHSAFGSYRLRNVRVPGDLSIDLGVHLSNSRDPAGPFAWIVRRAGAVRVGGSIGDVRFQLIPASEPTLALAIGEGSGDVRLDARSDSTDQLWKLTPYEMCDY
jgi:hypothetical protein